VEEYAKKCGVKYDTCEDKVNEGENSTGESVKTEEEINEEQVKLELEMEA